MCLSGLTIGEPRFVPPSNRCNYLYSTPSFSAPLWSSVYLLTLEASSLQSLQSTRTGHLPRDGSAWCHESLWTKITAIHTLGTLVESPEKASYPAVRPQENRAGFEQGEGSNLPCFDLHHSQGLNPGGSQQSVRE